MILRRFAALTLLLALAAAPALGASRPAIAITVTGQGRASQMPDMATLDLSVATNAAAAAAATSHNNAIYRNVLAALEHLGIAQSDVRTTYYTLGYTPRPAEGTAILPSPYHPRYGYTVTRGLQVSVRRTDLVGKAVDAAAASGVTSVGGVSFGVAANRALYDRALHEAVLDARAQADAMASAAGLHIVRITSLVQGYASNPLPMARMAAVAQDGAASVPTSIEPGTIEVQATVTVTYEAR